MFKDGDKVKFCLGVKTKENEKEQINIGIVRGIAINDVAILGKTYIIECIDGFIPNLTYNFKYCVCTENRMNLYNE